MNIRKHFVASKTNSSPFAAYRWTYGLGIVRYNFEVINSTANEKGLDLWHTEMDFRRSDLRILEITFFLYNKFALQTKSMDRSDWQ